MSRGLARLRDSLTLHRNEWGLAGAVVAVVLLTSILDQQHDYWHFPGESAQEILRRTAMLGIFALGSAIVIISGGIDLSSGSVIAFSGTIAAIIMLVLAPEALQTAQQPVGNWVIALAIAGALLTGVAIGSLHAWLITVVGLPPFVATLATLVGLRSLGRAAVDFATGRVLGNPRFQIDVSDERFRSLANQVWVPVMLCAAIALGLWLLMSRTVIGRHLYALGGNEEAARLSGIDTNRLKWFAYCTSAVLSSLAGVLYVGYTSSASPQTLGRGYELNAIAAAVVGGSSLQGGVGSVPGTILGVLFLQCVIDAIAKIIEQGSDVYEGAIVGMLVVLAVAFNQFRGARAAGRQLFPGSLGAVAGLTLAALAAAVVTFMVGVAAGAVCGTLVLLAILTTKIFDSHGRR